MNTLEYLKEKLESHKQWPNRETNLFHTFRIDTFIGFSISIQKVEHDIVLRLYTNGKNASLKKIILIDDETLIFDKLLELKDLAISLTKEHLTKEAENLQLSFSETVAQLDELLEIKNA